MLVSFLDSVKRATSILILLFLVLLGLFSLHCPAQIGNPGDELMCWNKYCSLLILPPTCVLRRLSCPQ